MENHYSNQLSPNSGDSQKAKARTRWLSPERYRSPLRLLIIIIAAIFMAEIVAMIAVYILPPLPYFQITLIDAAIMTVLIFPVLYFLSFHPLLLQINKSRKAEESLLHSRELQDRFFDSIDTLIVWMDRDFNFLRVNDAYARASGYPTEHFAGKNHFEIYPHAENRAIFQRVVDTGEGYIVYEKPFEYPDQPERGITYWNWSLQPVKSPEGTVEGLVLSLVDVTERKRAQETLREAFNDLELRVQERTEELRIANRELEEEIHIRKRTEHALRQSELGLKRAQEIAHLGNWELDLTNNQLTWSDEVYRIFGFQPQEFSPSYEAFLDAVHPDDRAAVDDAYTSSIREGKDGYEVEHRLIRRSTGETRILHEKCEHIRGEAGEIIRSVGMVHDITERKNAEAALRRSGALLLQTGQMAHVGGWELDLQTQALYWSPETYRIHEVDPSVQPDVENAINYYAPEARTLISEAVERAISQGCSYDLELPFVTATGRPLWVRTMGQPEFRDGTCVRLFGAFQDITQRRQAEDALRDARDELDLRVQERTEELRNANRELLREIGERKEIEKQLRVETTAIESVANGIIITDRDGNIEWTNPAMTQISGYETCDLIGQNMRIFKSGRQDAAYYQQMWESILSGKVWRGELTNRRKDGSHYVEEQTVTPLRDDHNQIAQFVAIKQDITERKKAEAALLASEEKFRTLVEWTFDWEIWLDPKGTIVYNSPSCERISGYRPEEFLAAPDLILRIIHPDDRAMYQEHQDIVHDASVGAEKIEYRIIARDGNERWIEHICRPLFGMDSCYLGRRVSNRDITEQKQAENDIRERAQKEKILTQTIHTMQLDIARDLHDTIGQNISFLRMKLDHLAEKKIRKQAELQLEIRNMAQVAEESWDLMRGTLAVLQSANSTDLFRLFTRYAEQIEERASFKTDLSTQGEPRFMSAKRMRQLFYVFREIMNNIEKHANASQVSIKMTWKRDGLNLVVFDNGSGFDPDTVQYGSHYGLKFMRERVELLNGSLLIRSASGSGTNITLQVPYE